MGGGIINLVGFPGDGIGTEVYPFVPTLLGHANDLLQSSGGSKFAISEVPYNASYYLEHGRAWPHGEAERLARNHDGAVMIALGDKRVPQGGMAHAVEIILNGLRGHPAWNTNFNRRPITLIHPVLRPALQQGPFSFELFVPPAGAIDIAEDVENEGTERETVFPKEMHSIRAFLETLREAASRAKALGQEKILVVHKNNVLRHSHGPWEDLCKRVAEESGVGVEMQLMDSFLERLVKSPSTVPSVVVTDRSFGTVLSRALPALSAGRREDIPDDFHLLFGRENTEGMYFRGGAIAGDGDSRMGTQIGKHSRPMILANLRECARIARAQGLPSFTLLHLDDAHPKAYGLWKSIGQEVAREYRLEVRNMHAGDFVAGLIRNPAAFAGQIFAADNVLGDICGDAAAALIGGLGFPATACVNTDGTTGKVYFEPLHGSAPDKAGQGIANPTATLLTTGMVFGHFGAPHLEVAMQRALHDVIEGGLRTFDMPGGSARTVDFGNAVIAKFLAAAG